MLEYAKYKNVWNKRKHGWKWPKLPLSNAYASAHDAVIDCQSTVDLVEAMAGVEINREILLDF